MALIVNHAWETALQTGEDNQLHRWLMADVGNMADALGVEIDEFIKAVPNHKAIRECLGAGRGIDPALFVSLSAKKIQLCASLVERLSLIGTINLGAQKNFQCHQLLEKASSLSIEATRLLERHVPLLRGRRAIFSIEDICEKEGL